MGTPSISDVFISLSFFRGFIGQWNAGRWYFGNWRDKLELYYVVLVVFRAFRGFVRMGIYQNYDQQKK